MFIEDESYEHVCIRNEKKVIRCNDIICLCFNDYLSLRTSVTCLNEFMLICKRIEVNIYSLGTLVKEKLYVIFLM